MNNDKWRVTFIRT